MIVNGNVVFPDPHARRSKHQSSWYCIGEALLNSVDSHNEEHSNHRVSRPEYNAVQLSRKIIRSARSWIATTEISKYVGTKSIQEISTQDPSTLFKSLQPIYSGICKEFRVLEHCEGNWAAREAVRQCLLNDKAGKAKQRTKSSNIAKVDRRSWTGKLNIKTKAIRADILKKNKQRYTAKKTQKNGLQTGKNKAKLCMGTKISGKTILCSDKEAVYEQDESNTDDTSTRDRSAHERLFDDAEEERSQPKMRSDEEESIVQPDLEEAENGLCDKGNSSDSELHAVKDACDENRITRELKEHPLESGAMLISPQNQSEPDRSFNSEDERFAMRFLEAKIIREEKSCPQKIRKNVTKSQRRRFDVQRSKKGGKSIARERKLCTKR